MCYTNIISHRQKKIKYVSKKVTMKLQFEIEVAIFLRPLTRRLFPFLAVRRSQSKTQSAFFNFKGQTALLVIVGLAAALRVFCRKCCQPFFEIGVMGLLLNDAAILVKIDHCCLLLFSKPCSHKTS